ncbi:hypothetical protein CCACVL1_30787 [Corchorus capsularis]|uniref:Uncharacterized protein n=1 Tax=Corchorus capsularis TaxID=210143 RepID=A0A1R3FVG4_COCAP|nr:hypothetical protein CCACVL1_30787 [Corchorus capsularis]
MSNASQSHVLQLSQSKIAPPSKPNRK